MQQFTAKIGNFTPTPSAPTPCKTSRLNFQEKVRICENLRFSAKICVLGSPCHLSSVPFSAPRISGFGRMPVAGVVCFSTLKRPGRADRNPLTISSKIINAPFAFCNSVQLAVDLRILRHLSRLSGHRSPTTYHPLALFKAPHLDPLLGAVFGA